MTKKTLLTRIAWFWLLIPISAFADIEDQLQAVVYAQGGNTLYCGTEFSASDRIKFDYIYNAQRLVKHYGCITARQCSSNESFNAAYEDMHNIYPIERKVDLDRRGSLFGITAVNARTNECGYSVSFQTFYPPAHARGNVARAILYMHQTYQLPLLGGTLAMYKAWNNEDPPDDAERARNNAIAAIQNKRNPYIDDPELADKIDGF